MKRWLALMLVMLLVTASACSPAADVTESPATETPQTQNTDVP